MKCTHGLVLRKSFFLLLWIRLVFMARMKLAIRACLLIVLSTIAAAQSLSTQEDRKRRIFSGTNEVTFARGIAEMTLTNAVVLRQYMKLTHSWGSDAGTTRVETKTLSNCIFVTNFTCKIGEDVWLQVQRMEPVVINGTRLSAFDHGRPANAAAIRK
jgi:hypothetical protein